MTTSQLVFQYRIHESKLDRSDCDHLCLLKREIPDSRPRSSILLHRTAVMCIEICTDSHQEFANMLSGSWRVTELHSAQTTTSNNQGT